MRREEKKRKRKDEKRREVKKEKRKEAVFEIGKIATHTSPLFTRRID